MVPTVGPLFYRPGKVMFYHRFSSQLTLSLILLVYILLAFSTSRAFPADLRTEIIQEIKLITIPAGTFVMGTRDTDDEWFSHSRPVREVRLDSFQLSVYEITQAQYEKVMGNNPSLMKGDDSRPVDQVSWFDAAAFCNKLSELAGLMPCYDIRNRSCIFSRNGFRLPTEAEWEYACRAGTNTRYYTGNSEGNLDLAGWYRANSQGTTHPVGQKEPNAWGLFDMHGNVWEWCNDWQGSYNDCKNVNPRGPNLGYSRVLRGGGWHYPAPGCCSAYRHRAKPEYRLSAVGFRIARSFNKPSGVFRKRPSAPGQAQ